MLGKDGKKIKGDWERDKGKKRRMMIGRTNERNGKGTNVRKKYGERFRYGRNHC
jgi:hypothetical protein